MAVAKKLSHPKANTGPTMGSFSDFKEELKKITWTSKDELKICTKAVLGSILCLGLGIYAIDLGLRGILEMLSRLVHLVG